MDNKIGVYICNGYGIAEALDIDELRKVVIDECEVPFCKIIPSCEPADIAKVIAEIKAEGFNKVLIAGVSARNYDDKIFPKGVQVEKLALREHVVWCQPPNEEDTLMMATDYIRMYIAKLKKMEVPEPFQPDEPIDKTLLVVGGGVTGMTAALNAAKAGYSVKLVEKSNRLGGWLGKQYKSIPTQAPFRELEDTGIDAMISDVETQANIETFVSMKTASIEGAPGLFDVTLASANGNGSGEKKFRVGAIIQATGWEPVDPRETLPYGKLDDVIRNVEYEEMMNSTGKVTRPSDGREVSRVAFIQCGGNRDKTHHSFCSSICCLTSLKQAMYLREQNKEAKAYIFYEFLRTPGHYEDFYRRVQDDPGVFLTKGDVVEVERQDNGDLLLTIDNTMPGKKIQVAVDLIVLAAGMKPNAADGEAIRKYNDAKVAAVKSDSDKQKQDAAKLVEELKQHEGREILNLKYRQGPDLPALQYGFPDSHFICFPYETRRTGIYAAGSVRQPMDGMASREDATGAALKAIQCVEMTSRGEAVHPRAGDTSYPEFFLQKCTQCKRCTEECPFGVLNEDEKGTPLLRATRCRRCGVCLGACPERIVSFKDYSISVITNMIKAVEVPDEDEEKPRILALLCENDAFPAMDLLGQNRIRYNPFIRIIPVRCLGSVNIIWVSEAFSAGYDGVILIGCKYGDDYQCHFIKGSELADSRGENIREKLQQMAMEDQRVEIHQLQISDYEKLPEIFDSLQKVIDEFGMNPFKGM
ncbi:MAG: hydrogenase iron-sulfur subunit [Candidatus Zixiibacteriota bacterium]